MTVHATPKLAAYAALAAIGFVASVVFGSPVLAVIVAPFAAVAGWGAVRSADPRVELEVLVDRAEAFVGETITVDVTIRSDVALLATVTPKLSAGLTLENSETAGAIRLRPDEPKTLSLPIACGRFGRLDIGRFQVQATDELGLLAFEQFAGSPRLVRVYPRPEPLRSLLTPPRVGTSSGDLLARTKGDGLEFADIREAQHGDRIRRINWAATSRRGAIHVNQYHPERNANVVLFLDMLTPPPATAPDLLNRGGAAVLALAERHLRRRDAVGLVCYGASVSWLTPRSGRDQLHRISETLLDASIESAAAVTPASALPRRLLRPGALVVALTPLHDPRSIRALLDLRGRGFDVVVVELATRPEPRTVEGDPVARLWELKRKAVRAWCASAGALVVPWRADAPLAAAIEEAHAWRRGAIRASA